jgi:hypothetical protein
MIGGYDNNEKRNEEKLMKEKKDRWKNNIEIINGIMDKMIKDRILNKIKNKYEK